MIIRQQLHIIWTMTRNLNLQPSNQQLTPVHFQIRYRYLLKVIT